MDPKENIKEQVRLARYIQNLGDVDVYGNDVQREDLRSKCVDAAERLADLVVALHEWREKGGFDPYLTREAFRDEATTIPPDINVQQEGTKEG